MRSYEAAKLTRFNQDALRSVLSPNGEIRTAHMTLLARARDLFNNASYVAGWTKHRLPGQVLGANGITIKPQIRTKRGGRDRQNKRANEQIQDAWERWCERGSCTADGQLSFKYVQEQVLKSVCRDGEVIVQLIRGKRAGNPFFFSLHLMEAEHLDIQYDDARGRTKVVMGVEVNEFRRPLAYHLTRDNPGAVSFDFIGRERVRLPASDVIHPFIRDYPSQLRGVTWYHAMLEDQSMLRKYREAELVAARLAASKVGVLTSPEGDGVDLQGQVRNSDGSYSIPDNTQPGQTMAVPKGWQYDTVDWNHPHQNFGDFEKAILRGIAASIGTSYHAYSGDLESVNYSSARQGALDEREVFQKLGTWFEESFLRPVFSAWLDMAMVSDEVRLPPQIIEEIRAGVRWNHRGFPWVDPAKESGAAIAELKEGLTSRTRILSSRGMDFEETMKQLAEEDRVIEELGLKLGGDNSTELPDSQGDPDDDKPGKDDDGDDDQED